MIFDAYKKLPKGQNDILAYAIQRNNLAECCYGDINISITNGRIAFVPGDKFL